MQTPHGIRMADVKHASSPDSAFEQQLRCLFAAVDKNQDGQLDVKEAASLFKQLAPDQSTRSAHNAAIEALLLTDSDADRHLNRTEFEALLTKVAGIAGMSAEAAVHRLHTALEAGSCSATQHAHDQAVSAGGMTAGSSNDSSSEHAVELGTADKLQQLFQLWDQTVDGSISFEELCQGLAKFRPVTGKKDMTSLLTEAASVLASHDTDGDRRLQFDEFSAFMVKFMQAAGYRLDEVLDELIVLAGKHDSKKLKAVLDSAQEQINGVLAAGQQSR